MPNTFYVPINFIGEGNRHSIRPRLANLFMKKRYGDALCDAATRQHLVWNFNNRKKS